MKNAWAGRPVSTNWGLEIFLTGSLIASLFVVKYVESSHWWFGQSPSMKRFIEGMCLEIFGLLFLWSRARRRTLLPKSFWDFRLFLFEIAMTVGGTWSLVEAYKLRR